MRERRFTMVNDRVHDGSGVNKDELYGPWIQVTNRRKKPQPRRELVGMGGSTSRLTRSRFAALSQLNDTIDFEDNQIGKIGQNDHSTGTLGLDLARGKSVDPPHAESSKNNNKGSEPLQPGNSSNKQQSILVRQGSSPKGIEAENSGNSLQFASVDQIAAPADNLIPKARNGKVLPMSITGSGAGKGQGLVENLSTELEKAQSDIVQHGTGMSASLHGDADEVQWRENTAFDTTWFEEMQD
ncbi:hypothetical protein V6N13_126120 [Hibiscus sabdariffa]